MSLAWPFKDPDEVLDYQVDWSARLDGDTIATSMFSLPTPAGVSKATDDKTSTTTTVWLTGGNEGEQAEILNRITTVGGRTMDQSVKIKIRSK